MFEEVKVGSLQSREFSEQVPFDSALSASDIFTDRDGWQGRCGYRSATAAAIGSSASVQLLGRHRVSPSSVRNVVATNGQVLVVTDPSSETASDGAATSLGTPFGASANLSGAQLYKNYYLGTDEASVAMRRINSGYTLDTLQDIQQGAKPTLAAFSALSWTAFTTLTDAETSCTKQTNGNTGLSAMPSTWRAFTLTNNGNNDPLNGAIVQYTLGTAFDATNYDWLAVAVTPRTGGGIDTSHQVEIQIAPDVTGSPGTWTTVGIIHDVPPIGGSPNLIFCDLRQIGSSDKSAIKYMRFYLSGASGGKFATYGYVFLPARPLLNPQTYYVTCQDATTLQESKPTEGLVVTIKDSDKLNQASPVPDLPYPDCYEDNATIKGNGSNDSFLGAANQRIFNRPQTGWAGKPMPALSDIGAVVTITVTLNASWVAGQVLRLWKDTDNGRRLITTHTLTSGDIGAGTVALADPGGLGVLTNVKFKPGGTGPRTNLLLAFGGRLVGGYENRVYISSFTAPDVTSSLFPQWPDVALESADGWSFDLDGGGGREQLQCGAAGDAIYLSTNERTIFMPELAARFDGGRVYYDIFNRGAVGRNACLWVENKYIWASWDGIYAAVGRHINWSGPNADELTGPIRDYYWRTFAPDSTTFLTYQQRNLYAITGTRMIRYNFATERWTTHTLSHTMKFASKWFDVDSSTQTGPQMWMLASDRKIYRWQPEYTVGTANAATSDAGTAIADWQYSTGFENYPETRIPKRLLLTCDNAVSVWVETTATDGDSNRRIEFTAGATDKAFPPDLKSHSFRLRMKGANTTTVKQAYFEREPVPQAGA